VIHFALAPRLRSKNCLGSLLYICWFDRGGLIGSSAIDVSKDLEGYLVWPFILQRFKDDGWGRLAALDDSTIHIQDKAWKVDAEDILHKPWGIIGRNTTVMGCSQQPPMTTNRRSMTKLVLLHTWLQNIQFLAPRVRTCQDFEFPVLLVLLYVRVASLFYIEQVGPDQF
jgi:hypothetical protein